VDQDQFDQLVHEFTTKLDGYGYDRIIQAVQESLIRNAIFRTPNIVEAAKRLIILRPRLYGLMERYNIEPKRRRSPLSPP